MISQLTSLKTKTFYQINLNHLNLILVNFKLEHQGFPWI